MERIKLAGIVFACSLVFVLGCAVGREKPVLAEPDLPADEKAALEALRSKGARFQWWDQKIDHKGEPIAPFWMGGFGGDSQVSDADVQPLRLIKNIKHLSFGSPNITDEGLAVLADLRELVYLSVGGQKISDRGIDKLADIKTLEHLTLGGMKLTGKAFERFGQLEKLKYLKFCLTIPEDGLGGLKTFKALEDLDLSETNVTDEDLKALKALERLERLFLRKTKVSDAGMAALADVPSLKYLDLSNTTIGNDGLKHLSRSKTLTTLQLGFTRVGDDGLAHIRDFGNLTSLHLGHEPISDEGLKHLRNTRLTNLRLEFGQNDRITDTGIESLQDIKTLKLIHNINIDFTKATKEGLRRLRKARPDLEINIVKQ